MQLNALLVTSLIDLTSRSVKRIVKDFRAGGIRKNAISVTGILRLRNPAGRICSFFWFVEICGFRLPHKTDGGCPSAGYRPKNLFHPHETIAVPAALCTSSEKMQILFC